MQAANAPALFTEVGIVSALCSHLRQREVYHYIRDQGFLIKVPDSWRELHAWGQKLRGWGPLQLRTPSCWSQCVAMTGNRGGLQAVGGVDGYSERS
jgi:hypothetical protein